MRKVAEEFTAEWVVTHILNDGAAVGVGVCLDQLLRSRLREPAQEEGLNPVLPRGIDNGLMRKDRISRTIGGRGHCQEKCENQVSRQ